MNKLYYALFIMNFIYCSTLVAQEKLEKESKINLINVPKKALSFIDSLLYPSKIKWYKEEGLNHTSIEAKLKHNNSKYSIEFDTLGTVEDIEIEINWQNISAKVSDSISKKLLLDCTKYKIVKTQKQFTGTEKELLSFLLKKTTISQPKLNYEIIVACKQQKKVTFFEYLFDEKGHFISKSKIIFKKSSHLEY